MPNHVRNILVISGDDSELKRFKDLMCSDTNPALKEHQKKCLENCIEICKKKESPFGKQDLKQAEQQLASLDKYQTNFTFNATVPSPPELCGTTSPCPKGGFEAKLQEEYQKKFEAGNWYDWNRKYWGVKWDAYDISDWYDKENGLAIDFNTAWFPPDIWLYHTAEKFPKLNFVDFWHSEGGETGRITVTTIKGEVALDYEFVEEHDWFMENNGMYRDEYDMVMQKDYKQAVKDVLEGNQSFGWSQNEERFIKRLKPEDLPLFVNFEWLNRNAYEAKMKEVL